MAKHDREKLIRDLQREIQERALLLSDLEVMIEDYQRERLRLVQELKSLKEGLWDLTGGGEFSEDVPSVSSASPPAQSVHKET